MKIWTYHTGRLFPGTKCGADVKSIPSKIATFRHQKHLKLKVDSTVQSAM
jgi:hypothetical protein